MVSEAVTVTVSDRDEVSVLLAVGERVCDGLADGSDAETLLAGDTERDIELDGELDRDLELEPDQDQGMESESLRIGEKVSVTLGTRDGLRLHVRSFEREDDRGRGDTVAEVLTLVEAHGYSKVPHFPCASLKETALETFSTNIGFLDSVEQKELKLQLRDVPRMSNIEPEATTPVRTSRQVESSKVEIEVSSVKAVVVRRLLPLSTIKTRETFPALMISERVWTSEEQVKSSSARESTLLASIRESRNRKEDLSMRTETTFMLLTTEIPPRVSIVDERNVIVERVSESAVTRFEPHCIEELYTKMVMESKEVPDATKQLPPYPCARDDRTETLIRAPLSKRIQLPVEEEPSKVVPVIVKEMRSLSNSKKSGATNEFTMSES
jgi:hypothetical protein